MKNQSNSAGIAIIGMACHYPGADDLQTFWENVLTAKRQFRTMPDIRLPLADYYDPDPLAPDKTYSSKAAFIDGYKFDWASHRIPKSTGDSTDIAQWLALDVALKALKDAGMSRETIPKERSGTILGNTLTGEMSRAEGLRLRWPFVRRTLEVAAKAKGFMPKTIDELLQTMEAYYKSVFAPITEDTLAGGLSNTIAGRICNYLDIHGGGYTVDGACSSSLVAVTTAANALTNGDLDIALAGGVDISLDTFELIGFAKTGALSRSDMAVYNRNADGFIPGEGCGFVVLQRLEDAIKERKYIYAVLRGWGISSDGKGGLTAPSAKGQALALLRAYDRAGYSAKDVDFFEGHGTGTPVGDKIELEGIALALGEEEKGSLRNHGITSFKSIVGHTKAASGIGGLIKAVIGVNRRILPPTANCVDPNPVFNETALSIYPILTGELLPASTKLKAGISAMGFGGINCHVTIESHDSPSQQLVPRLDERKLLASRQDTELFVLGASSIPALIDRAREIRRLVTGISESELVDLSAKLVREIENDMPVRASFISGSPEELLEGLQFLEKELKRNPPTAGEIFTNRQKDIYIGNSVQACRVGFLFPGQGSQLLNMGKVLLERHGWAQKLIDNADKWLAQAGGANVIEAMFRPLQRAGSNKEVKLWQDILQQTEIAQPAICLISLLWMEKLAQLGIRPDVVGGHSLGELTAFYAAGIFDQQTLINFASFRGQTMAAPGEESGAMASLACSVETAKEIIQSVDDHVVVANINGPKQTVISGEKQSVAKAVKLAKEKEITTYILKTSNAFHSKFVHAAADLLRTKAPIPKTADYLQVKAFSGMTGREVLPGLKLADHFANQAITPVDFISLVESMARECDLLVEVGPGKVLSKLTNSIIHEKSPVCLPVEAKPGQDRDLNTVLGKYFVHGGNIQWDTFFADRLVRPFVPASERTFIENPCERPYDVSLQQEQIDQAAAEIDATFARAIDISPQDFAAYLSLRGKFLETIIKADIENLSQLRGQSVFVSQAETAMANLKPLSSQGLVEKSAPVQTAESVEGLLYELLEKRTGFPKQSLSPEHRLLDDLNLDSIKAADLLAEVTLKLKVAGEIDLSQYANATLREIINTIDGLVTGKQANLSHDEVQKEDLNAEAIVSFVKKNIALLTGHPVETLKDDALLGADLNMSLEHLAELLKHLSQQLTIELNVDLPPLLNRNLVQLAEVVGRIFFIQQQKQLPLPTIEHPPWVRDIHTELIETQASFSESHQRRRYEDNWKYAKVLLLNSGMSGNVKDGLQDHLNTLGATVTLQELNETFDPGEVKNTATYSHFIVILPQEADQFDRYAAQLEEMIARLASIASPLPAAAAPRRRTNVAYIQFGGGRFGTSPEASYLNICCASALAKSLHLERDDLRVRVIDFDPALPAQAIAEKVTTEMHMPESFAAIGYDRFLTRRELKQRLLQPSEYQDRPFTWSQEDVILVTGGAKGITAACAYGVSQATGARIALLGRSPHPDDQPDSTKNSEIAATLKKYTDSGLTAHYFCCDVSKRDSIKEVVQQIRTTMGPVTGVIHGAGLNVPRLVNQVSIQEALNEVSPKILGILNLMDELQNSPPQLFVGLSSIIGVTGMPGNGWYGFSNEALDVLLHRIEADCPQTKTLSVAYSIWREEGMGVRMGSVGALKKRGIDSIPSEEGVKRFTRLFVKDPGVHQVIIAARLDGFDTWQWQAAIPESKGRFMEKPLHITPGVESVFQAHLDIETDSYLKDHVFNGSYLFPTVFGLEAMAQAVAHVTGKSDFSRIRIENIQLKRPITVDPETGADIVVWAELAEPETPSSLQTVHAGLYKPGMGQNTDYFSATFVLGLEKEKVEYDINLPDTPLEIKPSEDLYNGRLLFQGPLFQRLRHIYALDSIRCIFDSKIQPDSSTANEGQEWFLGDPFFRDSLLHSTQVSVSQHICLPIHIESIERFSSNDVVSGSFQGITVINNLTEEEVYGSLIAVNEDGQVVERLNGYVLKIMEYHQDYPTPEEIVDPGHRDENIIYDEIKKHAELFDVNIPGIAGTYLSGLKTLTKKERHFSEMPILQRAVQQSLGTDGNREHEINIDWLDSGKPVLEGEDFFGWHFSLSHDRGTVICVAGEGLQGCDIESITHRTQDEWIALISKDREFLLDDLVSKTESIDQAGTRIWVAIESSAKAIGSGNIDLRIERQEGDSVLFKACGADDEDIHILTFPVVLTLGLERMVAVTVEINDEKMYDLGFPTWKSHAEKLNFDQESYKVNIENGPQDQPVFVFHFPVTFKEASNLSKTLYFSNYFIWLGKLREYIVQPIYDKLIEYFSSGKWGMVTNHAETRIFGEAQSGDIIEGRLWLDKVSGKEKSTLEFLFEWRKKQTNGEYQLIAMSTMSTSWVAIRGHGFVEIQPFPEFGVEYVNALRPRSQLKSSVSTVSNSISVIDFGRELYSEPAGPVRESALLKEKLFETCLEDSNLVGNIYFSNYYIWQGRVLDNFLHEIAPEYFLTSEKQGELRCVHCKFNHLTEAMPYDRIVLRMYRLVVHEKAIRFYFDYHKLLADGGRQKLGYGIYEAIWYSPVLGKNKWQPSDLPVRIREVLIPKGKKEVLSNATKRFKKGDNQYDVIVVGSGIGGLTAASLLAKKGANVAVVEQHNKPGGFCTSWERRIKFKGQTLRYVFDAGVHDILGLGPQGIVRKLINDLNIEDKIDWRRVDHQYIFSGLQIKVPRDIDEYISLLCEKFPRERDGITAFFQDISQCYSELYGQTARKLHTSRWMNVSFCKMIDTFIFDKRLKELLSILHHYITDDVRKLKSLTMIPMFGYYIDGGYYPSGGSQVFPDILAEIITRNGGNIFLKTAVSKVDIENQKVGGVKLANGSKMYSPTVILNSDIRRTFSNLIDSLHLHGHYCEQIKNLIPSNSAFMVNLGINFVPDIEPMTLLIEKDRSIGIMIPSKVDPSIAPEGHAALTLIELIPYGKAITWRREERGYRERKERKGNELISLAEKAIPDLHNHIMCRQDASPATFSRYAWTLDGAIYGTEIDSWKPSVKTPIQGLYLASASIAGRPGVGDAVHAGMLSSNAILRQENHGSFFKI